MVDLDDVFGVILWAELEVVFVKTERRFGHQPEFIVERRVKNVYQVDSYYVRFAVLSPDLV